MHFRILTIAHVLAAVVSARPNHDGGPSGGHYRDRDGKWQDHGDEWGPSGIRWGHGDHRWGHSGGKEGSPWYPGSWDGKWNDWHNYFPWFNGHDVFYFDEILIVEAVPEQVVSSSLARRSTLPIYGQSGASGIFRLGINIADNVICYNITISGLTSTPSAVQLHQGVRGINGPAVLSFPVPTGSSDHFDESGCLTVPFSPTSSSTSGTPSFTSTTELSPTSTDSLSVFTTEPLTYITDSSSISTNELWSPSTELPTSSTTSISSSSTTLPPPRKVRRDEIPSSTSFDLSQIVIDPSDYYVEVDTAAYPNGAIRGQLRKWYRGWGWGWAWYPDHP